jgi:HD-like signal output (HDOD) protein
MGSPQETGGPVNVARENTASRLIVPSPDAAAGKRRILFVDDEQSVLDGLRNLLRRQRQQWDMLFVTSGKAALEELVKQPVDVIVSDMRMPGMDGAELLTRVRDLYPQTARIVLSGHAEREAIARVVSVAHQFLSKPSDADTVRKVVERTCVFQALLQNEGIRRVIGSIDRLPSLPAVYMELNRATQDPKTGIADIVRIIEKDPAMSIKILQLVNSAYFGLAQKTSSVLKAASYLGVENLKGLLVVAHVFSADAGPSAPGFSLDRLRDESLVVAQLARQMVRDPKNTDTAFTAGLVHDIGQLVLSRHQPDAYGHVLQVARQTGRQLSDVEKEELGVSHGLVGAYLLGVWGLPFVLSEALMFHHDPSAVTEGGTEIIAALHLANGVVSAAVAGRAPLTAGALDSAYLDKLGLLSTVPRWHEKALDLLGPLAGAGAK